MRIYVVRGGSSWGDYGRILVHGMSKHLPRSEGLIQLERTGPLVPDVTAPGGIDLIVTDRIRSALEKSGLTGLSYRPVIKTHIALGPDWDSWDTSLRLPPTMSPGDEPEGYVLGAPHDPELARAMGSLWEVVAEKTWGRAGKRTIISRNPHRFETHIVADIGQPPDFSHARGLQYTIITEQAREWLEAYDAAKWLVFDDVIVDEVAE